MPKTLRVLYAAGPGDVIGTYRHWAEGNDDPSQVSITYSAQFYEVCRALDAQAYVISSNRERNLLRDGQFTIEHRPNPLGSASGIFYHLGMVWYGLRLIASAIRFRANAAVVAEGTTYWFVLSLLPLLGVSVIPSLHCLLWRQYVPQSTTEKWRLKLARNFFAKHCAATLAVSDDISKQITQLTKGEHQPILRSFPAYRREQFEQISEPPENLTPFRVLFVGRVEPEKGVFDLLEIAKRFAAQGRQDIRFDLCGDGSALKSLRRAAKEARVDSFFFCHGHCNKPEMREMFGRSHVVIVPTRTSFAEGFNKVVVEGVLAGRPVVTSAACPNLSLLMPAIVEVPPNDVTAYGDALLKLCSDRKFYQQKRAACVHLQGQFYDLSRSWGSRLKAVLLAIQEDKKLDEVLALPTHRGQLPSAQWGFVQSE
ncbi:MAG: glycosyltransferase family 4 protein [Cyanobacteriota bacterium]